MDFSIFTSPETWVTLLTLTFLEIILGVDNIVFISITSDRLPEAQQHLGRKLGLAGALVSRIIFLCFASYLVHMTQSLFTIELGFYSHGFSVRDVVLLLGGGYLIYKGIVEVREVLGLTELKAVTDKDGKSRRTLGLAQAAGTIMVMDVVFSIDSVITAVGLADQLIVMILAVMIAVFLMMIFIDPISNFINKHVEMKILALVFITVIGVLLMVDSLGFHSGIEVLDMAGEKLMVYFAMVFAIVLELIQMRYNKNFSKWKEQHAEAYAAAYLRAAQRDEDAEEAAVEAIVAEHEGAAQEASDASGKTAKKE